MKAWLWFGAFLGAVCVLSRLPHPAVDVGELEPVQVVAVVWSEGAYHLSADTGASGRGATLAQAAENLSEGATGKVFLETAEFVLLAPGVPVTEEFCAVLRPSCRVSLAPAGTDPEAAGEYLRVHPPGTTLNDLRAGKRTLEWLRREGEQNAST